jgi:hypothetical protein
MNNKRKIILNLNKYLLKIIFERVREIERKKRERKLEHNRKKIAIF